MNNKLLDAIQQAEVEVYQRTIECGLKADKVFHVHDEDTGHIFVISNPVCSTYHTVDGEEMPRRNLMLEYTDKPLQTVHPTGHANTSIVFKYLLPKLMPILLPQLIIVLDSAGNVLRDGADHTDEQFDGLSTVMMS